VTPWRVTCPSPHASVAACGLCRDEVESAVESHGIDLSA